MNYNDMDKRLSDLLHIVVEARNQSDNALKEIQKIKAELSKEELERLQDRLNNEATERSKNKNEGGK